MVPLPTVLGLIVCEKVIVEEGTKNVSLVSTFERLNVERVPNAPRPFVIFTTRTDGEGDGTIQVVVTRLETDEVVRVFRGPIQFPNRLAEVRVLFHVNRLSFPAPGRYLIALLIDGDLLAQRDLRVLLKEDRL